MPKEGMIRQFRSTMAKLLAKAYENGHPDIEAIRAMYDEKGSAIQAALGHEAETQEVRMELVKDGFSDTAVSAIAMLFNQRTEIRGILASLGVRLLRIRANPEIDVSRAMYAPDREMYIVEIGQNAAGDPVACLEGILEAVRALRYQLVVSMGLSVAELPDIDTRAIALEAEAHSVYGMSAGQALLELIKSNLNIPAGLENFRDNIAAAIAASMNKKYEFDTKHLLETLFGMGVPGEYIEGIVYSIPHPPILAIVDSGVLSPEEFDRTLRVFDKLEIVVGFKGCALLMHDGIREVFTGMTAACKCVLANRESFTDLKYALRNANLAKGTTVDVLELGELDNGGIIALVYDRLKLRKILAEMLGSNSGGMESDIGFEFYLMCITRMGILEGQYGHLGVLDLPPVQQSAAIMEIARDAAVRSSYLKPIKRLKTHNVAIPTGNRPETLRASLSQYVDNVIMFKHDEAEITVFDDSDGNADDPGSNAGKVFGLIAELNRKIDRHNQTAHANIRHVRYAGRAEKEAFLAALSERTGIKAEDLGAIFGKSAGGNRNYALAGFAGEVVTFLDDDSFPTVTTATRERQESAERIRSERIQENEKSFFAEMEQFLGVPITGRMDMILQIINIMNKKQVIGEDIGDIFRRLCQIYWYTLPVMMGAVSEANGEKKISTGLFGMAIANETRGLSEEIPVDIFGAHQAFLGTLNSGAAMRTPVEASLGINHMEFINPAYDGKVKRVTSVVNWMTYDVDLTYIAALMGYAEGHFILSGIPEFRGLHARYEDSERRVTPLRFEPFFYGERLSTGGANTYDLRGDFVCPFFSERSGFRQEDAIRSMFYHSLRPDEAAVVPLCQDHKRSPEARGDGIPLVSAVKREGLHYLYVNLLNMAFNRVSPSLSTNDDSYDVISIMGSGLEGLLDADLKSLSIEHGLTAKMLELRDVVINEVYPSLRGRAGAVESGDERQLIGRLMADIEREMIMPSASDSPEAVLEKRQRYIDETVEIVRPELRTAALTLKHWPGIMRTEKLGGLLPSVVPGLTRKIEHFKALALDPDAPWIGELYYMPQEEFESGLENEMDELSLECYDVRGDGNHIKDEKYGFVVDNRSGEAERITRLLHEVVEENLGLEQIVRLARGPPITVAVLTRSPHLGENCRKDQKVGINVLALEDDAIVKWVLYHEVILHEVMNLKEFKAEEMSFQYFWGLSNHDRGVIRDICRPALANEEVIQKLYSRPVTTGNAEPKTPAAPLRAHGRDLFSRKGGTREILDAAYRKGNDRHRAVLKSITSSDDTVGYLESLCAQFPPKVQYAYSLPGWPFVLGGCMPTAVCLCAGPHDKPIYLHFLVLYRYNKKEDYQVQRIFLGRDFSGSVFADVAAIAESGLWSADMRAVLPNLCKALQFNDVSAAVADTPGKSGHGNKRELYFYLREASNDPWNIFIKQKRTADDFFAYLKQAIIACSPWEVTIPAKTCGSSRGWQILLPFGWQPHDIKQWMYYNSLVRRMLTHESLALSSDVIYLRDMSEFSTAGGIAAQDDGFVFYALSNNPDMNVFMHEAVHIIFAYLARILRPHEIFLFIHRVAQRHKTFFDDTLAGREARTTFSLEDIEPAEQIGVLPVMPELRQADVKPGGEGNGGYAILDAATAGGSIPGVFAYLLDNGAVSPETAISGADIAEGLDRSFKHTIIRDLRALYYQLRLIKTAGPAARDPRLTAITRFYIPKYLADKAGDIRPVLARFRGNKLRPGRKELERVAREELSYLAPSYLEDALDERAGRLDTKMAACADRCSRGALVLYADDILNDLAVFDIRKTVKAMAKEGGILN
ncbi:MAG: hypothetical protein ABH885_05485, partial [Candidatus Omnitrophota bacterium]